MFAYDYPLLGFFWTTMMIFVWIIWLFLLFRIFADIFRSQDLGGFAKTLWIIFVVLLPFLGIFVYLIARGHGMAERSMAMAQAQQEAFDTRVRAAAGASTADELTKLVDLHAKGLITDAELESSKAKLLQS